MNQVPAESRKDVSIILETIQQISKDFPLSGELTVSPVASLMYESLQAQLIPELERLYDSDRKRFMGMLYKVDISEAAYSAITGKDRHDFFSTLAGMILRREFKKVLIRRYFSER